MDLDMSSIDPMVLGVLANSGPTAMGLGYRPDVKAKIDALTSIGPAVNTPGGPTYDLSNAIYTNPVSGLPFFNSSYHAAQVANSEAAERNRNAWDLGGPGSIAALVMGAAAAGGAFANGGAGWGASPVNAAASSPNAAAVGAGGAATAGGAGGATAAGAGAAAAGAAGAGAGGAGAAAAGGLLSNLNWQDWLGLGGNILGGFLQSDAEKDAAQMMDPWNVQGLFGSAMFDPATRMASINADPQTVALRGLLGSNVSNLLGGAGLGGFQNFAAGLGNQALPGLFNEAQAALGNLPTDAFNQFNSTMANAQGLAGQDVSSIINNRLGLLREQAAPQEQQAFKDLEQRLFSQGRLGTTGGSRNIEAFARGLAQADLARQIEAQNLGLQTQQQNLNAAGMLGNLGLQNFGAALNYNDLGANRAAQRMQNAMGIFGFGQNLQQENTRAGIAGLTGLLGLDQNQMNLAALGRNLSADPYQAKLAGNSPLGALLGGLGAMSNLWKD